MPATQSVLNLSSNSYVPMRIKPEAGGEDDVQPTPTKIASEKRCLHETTVCVTCLPEWQADWQVFFGRTNGGRRLAARAGITL